MATLTGAQGISTGQYHAAVLTNNELWETSCVQAGRMSGDLCVSLHLMHIFLHFFFFSHFFILLVTLLKAKRSGR